MVMSLVGYFVLGFLVLLVAAQWRLTRRAQRLKGQALPELDLALAERLKARGKAVLYFFSPGCLPCRAMTPVIDRLAREHDNLFKVDVSRDVETARRFQVTATPTLMVLSTTTIESVTLGTVSESRIRDLLA
jgi:thioredoxin 1